MKNLHETNMTRAASLSKDELVQVCLLMNVQPCKTTDIDNLCEALSDASWDGQHGTEEDFDRRLSLLLTFYPQAA